MSGHAPASTLARGAAAAALAALLLLAASAGYDALEGARAQAAQLTDAARIADALAQAAGGEADRPGTLAKVAADLQQRHGHRVLGLYVSREGGVDEFGIARGAALELADDWPEDARKAALDHGAALAEVANRALAAGEKLDWTRMVQQRPGGERLLAVPYRGKGASEAAGVAGVRLPAIEGALPQPPLRWALVLLAALAMVGLGRALPGVVAGIVTGVLTAAGAVALSPALTAAGTGGVDILAADYLIPHAPAPSSAALAAAEQWLGLALVALGGVLGATLPGIAEGLTAARRDPAPYLYVGPSVVATGVLVFVPFAVGVGLSFGADGGGFAGIDNYAAVLRTVVEADESAQFGRTFLHTVLWTVTNVTMHVVIGLGLALVLNRPDLRGRKIYRLLLIVPWAVPNYITALTWKWLFNTQYGPINSMLSAAGIERIDWLSQSGTTAFVANLATNVWLGFPFMMVISLGALQSIPADLYEAADIDGASGWQKLRHVTLPLLRPALFPAIILGTIWTFNAFNIIYLVSGGGPDHKTEILITEAYHLFTVLRRTGLAAAYAVLIFLLLLGYTLVTNRMTQATEAVDR
ncbi:MAG: hypothetical protein RIT45_4225 [Pseudomonadota bacterium]